MNTTLKILLFVRRIGPYHHARFSAVKGDVKLVVAETRAGSQEYPWKFSPTFTYTSLRFPVSPDPEAGIKGAQLTEEIEQAMDENHPDVVVTTG